MYEHVFTTFYCIYASQYQPFETDSLEEALRDAEWKSTFCWFVRVEDILDRTVIEYRGGAVKVPFYGLKQLED